MTASARRVLAFVAIALLAFGVGLALRAGLPGALGSADDFFYDVYYRTRPVTSQKHGPVVIVSADEGSLEFMDKAMEWGWPWPRQESWGRIAKYFEDAGAQAVVFDIVFVQRSAAGAEDDEAFAKALSGLKIPVVFGSNVGKDGVFDRFAPPVAHPIMGAVNVNNDKIYRRYNPTVAGQYSLAAAAVQAVHLKSDLPTDRSFLLHYYGPHDIKTGETPFQFVPVAAVYSAIIDPKKAAESGMTPGMFKDKIVVLGTSAIGTYDLKASPLSPIYPGVEVQATAITNLLAGDAVVPVGGLWRFLLPLLAALGVSAGVIFPRAAWVKSLSPVLLTVAIIVAGIVLFRGVHIAWLTPTDGLLVVALTTPTAFAWTYFAEDRQRRFMLKALSKVVSPAVAEQLAANPERLQLGTVRTDLTLIFTDLANFTDLAETMDVETLGKMINRYLGEMSNQVLDHHGTLDKYIGDAVMCFWNAPIPQADHAVRACKAALAMVKREAEIADELIASSGAKGKQIYTRIGLNTTSAAVGFVGSSHLFNYTALGDGVNLASRLEGANKMYGTRILLSETTAAQVKEQFVLRKVDVLRVKGKKLPMAVFELVAERGGAGDTPGAREKAAAYEGALAAYQRQEWAGAEKMLLELLEKFGQDGPAKTLLGRVTAYRVAPPGGDWDGVYVAKEK